MILASCSYEESKKYRGRLVLVSEEDVKKPEEVFLNIVTDSPDAVLSSGLGRAKCITTDVEPTNCPQNLYGSVFYEVAIEDFENVCEVEGVVTLVRLPEGFSDMRRVFEICSLNSNYTDVKAKVRVIGGNLLEIPGVSIGRYDDGKDKLPAVYNGTYDFFRELSLSDIKVKEVFSKAKVVGIGGKSSSTIVKKATSKNKKKETLSKFFGDSNGGF